MSSRRGFLSSILGLAAAPAIVSASSIMRVTPVMGPADKYALRWVDANKVPMTDTSWMAVEESDQILALRPTKILLPGFMMAEALKILNAEFDKAYTQYDKQWGLS